ncbi:MAG: NAD(P)/FAD-dependent oxidoreductase [Thermoplasmatota archaeon]
MDRLDTLVIGGGILGCAAALALAQEGHDVVLREQANLAAGSTAKAAGIVSTMTWCDDDYSLVAETRGLVGELISLATGEGSRHVRGAWRPYDSITVAKGEAGLRHLDGVQDRLERHTEEPERLGWREAAAAFPGVVFEPGEEALVAQEDGVIEAGDLFDGIRTRLDAEGVEVQENAPVTSLADAPPAETTVVAGGAWTKPLLAEAGLPLPVQHFRTQAASLQLEGSLKLPIVHDTVKGFYTRPESEGTTMAGDGTILRHHDVDDYDEAASPDFRDSIAVRVVQRFERGAQALWRTGWAGLCVATPDRRPLCGPHPDRDGLFVLTGDNGFGLMRGFALGQRLADAVDGQVHSETDIARFWPDPSDDFEMQEGYGL